MMLLLAPDGTISELWMGQNVEGRGRGQIRNTTSAVVWMDWGKPTQNLRHYSWSSCLGMHPALSTHEAGAYRSNEILGDSWSKYIPFLQKKNKQTNNSSLWCSKTHTIAPIPEPAQPLSAVQQYFSITILTTSVSTNSALSSKLSRNFVHLYVYVLHAVPIKHLSPIAIVHSVFRICRQQSSSPSPSVTSLLLKILYTQLRKLTIKFTNVCLNKTQVWTRSYGCRNLSKPPVLCALLYLVMRDLNNVWHVETPALFCTPLS